MNREEKPHGPINLKLWIGLLLSALFLFLAFRQVDLPRIWTVIRSSRLHFLLLAGAVTFFQQVIRAWLWRVLLEPVKKTGFMNRLLSLLIGFAANCLLPARLGEFIRASYLGRRENISGSSAFGTIVVERIFDGFTLLFILLIGLMGTTFPDELQKVSGTLRTTGLTMFLAYILIIVFIIGFKYRTDVFLTIFNRVLFFLSHPLRSRATDMIRNFSRGLVPMRNGQGWAQAIFYSFFLWTSSLYQIQLVEFSIGLSLPFIATFLIMAMASFGVIIPSAPGFIGTFHLAAQYGFLFYGVPREEALSAAILWHAAFFFPTILFGLIAFIWLQIPNGWLSEKVRLHTE